MAGRGLAPRTKVHELTTADVDDFAGRQEFGALLPFVPRFVAHGRSGGDQDDCHGENNKPETCSAQALQGYRQKRHTTRNRGRGMAEETEKERINREIIELLNEVRVTLPGVQVLFA